MNLTDHTSPQPRLRRGRAAARRLGIVSGVLTVMLSAGLAAPTPLAFADDLEDRKAALEAEAARVQQSLEFVDSRIAKAAGDLVIYQGQLPGAQQALLEAQGRVAALSRKSKPLPPVWTWHSRTKPKSPSSSRPTSRRLRTPRS